MKKSWVFCAFLAFVLAVIFNENGGFSKKSEEASLSQEELSFANTLNEENRRTFVKLFSPEQRELAIKSKGMAPNVAVQTVEKEIAIEVVHANDFAETTLVR